MIYIGDNSKARKVVAPYIGVSGTARRVLKGYVGVSDKARLFYSYLDDIDHVECEFYSVTGYTDITSQGGTKIWSGTSGMGSNASFSNGSNTFTGSNNSGSNAKIVYIYFRFWAVLKGGYKLRMNYPYSTDGKGVSVTITQTSNTSPSGETYGTWLFLSPDDDNDGFYSRSQNNSAIVFNWEQSTTSYSGFLRLYKNRSAGYRIDKATINGKDYSVTVVNNFSST